MKGFDACLDFKGKDLFFHEKASFSKDTPAIIDISSCNMFCSKWVSPFQIKQKKILSYKNSAIQKNKNKNEINNKNENINIGEKQFFVVNIKDLIKIIIKKIVLKLK